jgi:hypothetical protein
MSSDIKNSPIASTKSEGNAAVDPAFLTNYGYLIRQNSSGKFDVINANTKLIEDSNDISLSHAINYALQYAPQFSTVKVLGSLILDNTIIHTYLVTLEFDTLTLASNMTTDAIDVTNLKFGSRGQYVEAVNGKNLIIPNGSTWSATALKVRNCDNISFTIGNIHNSNNLGTGIGLYADSGEHIVSCQFKANVHKFNVNLYLETDNSTHDNTAGWINENYFEVQLTYAKLYNLQMQNNGHAINGNVFMKMYTEPSAYAGYNIYLASAPTGTFNPRIAYNQFIAYKSWDLKTPAFPTFRCYYADKTAFNNAFIGGFVHSESFDDNGANTIFAGVTDASYLSNGQNNANAHVVINSPSVAAKGYYTGLTDSQFLARLTAPSSGMHELGGYVKVESYKSGSLKVKIWFKDEDGMTQTIELTPIGATSTTIAAKGIYLIPSTTVNCQSGATIEIEVVVNAGSVLSYNACGWVRVIDKIE